MPGKTATRKRPSDTNALQDLFSKISAIFDQVQNTSANHQKNIIALHKVYVDIVQIRGKTRDGDSILTGERQFEQDIYALLLRLLQSKKGGPGDRVVKFFAGFVRYLNEKAVEDPVHEDDIDEFEVAYPPAARFTERLVCKLLVNGFAAKEKLVRYRTVQICAELVFNLGEIDDNVYYDLRNKLLERIKDKETNIRSQASIALCKFSGIDDPEELEEKELDPLSQVLFESLSYDPQPEVRRAILLNLPINKESIVHILERTRDVDATIRKLVYGVLSNHVTSQDDDDELSMGFTHPRALKIEQREQIVRNGLGDRDSSVRGAAAKLIEKWVESADLSNNSKRIKDENEGEAKKDEDELGLLGLLKMFDLREDNIVADAIVRIFESNPQILSGIAFDDAYWTSLTPETVFLARTCVDFCTSHNKYAELLDTILPVVTSFAFRIQEYFNALVETIQSYEQALISELDDETRILKQDSVDDKKFIVAEMLRIAIELDYGDEIGRRKMDSLVREMLIHDFLPEDLVAPCMEVMSRLADNERDLVRVIAIEVVQALRDPGDNEDEDQPDVDPDSSFDSTATPAPAKPNKTSRNREEMTEAEQTHADKIDGRCLRICESMLERINGTLENNSSLDGILKELIYPAAQRKDGDFREQGYRCLGLISLISKSHAKLALGFFVKEMMNEQNPEELRIVAMHTVFDSLMKYDMGILQEPLEPAGLVDRFAKLLKEKELSEDVRAVLCMGLAKLALPGVLVDEKIMELLLKNYFSPENANNPKLKQCLSFFFQAYCASSVDNQKMISTMFMRVFNDLCEKHALMEDDEEMASMTQIANIIFEWTRPDKLFSKDKGEESEVKDSRLHFDIARDIVKELLNKDSNLLKEHKKVLCQQLSKLHLSEKVDEDEVRYLNLLMDKVPSCRPLGDTVSKNAFTKFQTLYSKKYEKALEGLSAEEYRAHEKHREEAAFLDAIVPLDDEPVQPVKQGRKRRSGSIASSAAEDEPSGGAAKKASRSRKGRAKRPRLSTSDSDESGEGDGEDEGTERSSIAASSRRSSVAPTRTMPKRQATRKPPVEIIAISSDSDEDDEEATPRDRRPRPSAPKVKQEEVNDRASQATVRQDDDDDDSEEEDEVSGLLAED